MTDVLAVAADVTDAVLMLTGAVLCLIASIGLLRFGDLYSRLHAASKPQVLGLLCVMAAVAIRNPGFAAIATIILSVGFQLLTVPISAHMIGRAAYRSSISKGTIIEDQLSAVVSDADD
jgi:multicomponent Na+:H+ antiporter subunit G